MDEVSCHAQYLGLPSAISKNMRHIFGNIKDRVWKKLQSWKSRLFSCGGREILVKAVAQVIPTYAMSCFKLPSSLSGEIQSLCSDFWWGIDANKKNAHWLAWSKMHQPKELGGMGFRDLEKFNQAMLAK
ncbi:hypothetical protein ACOSQ4_032991 [Xanthoceras sorbifolium]